MKYYTRLYHIILHDLTAVVGRDGALVRRPGEQHRVSGELRGATRAHTNSLDNLDNFQMLFFFVFLYVLNTCECRYC